MTATLCWGVKPTAVADLGVHVGQHTHGTIKLVNELLVRHIQDVC